MERAPTSPSHPSPHPHRLARIPPHPSAPIRPFAHSRRAANPSTAVFPPFVPRSFLSTLASIKWISQTKNSNKPAETRPLRSSALPMWLRRRLRRRGGDSFLRPPMMPLAPSDILLADDATLRFASRRGHRTWSTFDRSECSGE